LNICHLIPHRKSLLAAGVGASYICLYYPNRVILSAIPLSYVVIYIGLLDLPRIPFGDLSYGVYLFHYPIARCLHELFGRNMRWEILLFSTIVLTGIFSLLSWRAIEKPTLDKRKIILATIDDISAWATGRLVRLQDWFSESFKYGGPRS
jgi:peptidoglycan/LPS O-acetylase OafA/YrhL